MIEPISTVTAAETTAAANIGLGTVVAVSATTVVLTETVRALWSKYYGQNARLDALEKAIQSN